MDVVGGEAVGAAQDRVARAVFDKFIGPADAFDGGGAGGVLQGFKHGAAEAAGEHVVFHGDDERDDGGLAEEERAVEGLDEAGVDDADGEVFLAGEAFGESEGVGDHGAEGPDHDLGAVAQDLGLADGEGDGLGFDLGARAGAARVADEAGAGELQAGVEHVDEFVLVFGLHDRGAGDAAEVSDVEETVMRGAIGGGEAGAVHAEGDGEVLQGDVVDDLVVGALEEGGVNRADGAEALGGETGGEKHGVFLGDADVEELFRDLVGEVDQTRAAGHGAGDTEDLGVGLGEADEGVAEDVLEIGRGAGGGGFALAGGGIE